MASGIGSWNIKKDSCGKTSKIQKKKKNDEVQLVVMYQC